MALKHVTTRDFRSEVLESSVPVVVDFYADWCGPCHHVAPILEQLAGRWGRNVKVVKVDTESDPDLAAPYRISTIPAVLLFRDGQVAAWSLGSKPAYLIEKELGIKPAARDKSGRAAVCFRD